MAIPKRDFLGQMIPILNGYFNQEEIRAGAADSNNSCETILEPSHQAMVFPHTMLIWNSPGNNSAKYLEDLKCMISEHNPTMAHIVDSKKKTEEVDSIIQQLGFTKRVVVDTRGFSGGLWLPWQEEGVDIEGEVATPWAIHAIITLSIGISRRKTWRESTYCSTTVRTRGCNGDMQPRNDINHRS